MRKVLAFCGKIQFPHPRSPALPSPPRAGPLVPPCTSPSFLPCAGPPVPQCAEAFADVQAAAAAGVVGGVRGWIMVRLWRQGRPVRLGPRTAIPHCQPPYPIPPLPPSHPSPTPPPHTCCLARRWLRSLGAGPRGSVRADPWPCTPAGPAGRAYKNTGLQTELQLDQPTEAVRSSSPFFSSSPVFSQIHCSVLLGMSWPIGYGVGLAIV